MQLKATCIDTPLGPMIALSDEKALHLLEFLTKKGLDKSFQRLSKRGFSIIRGEAPPLSSIALEIKAYFDGKLTQFETPYHLSGTPFQQEVWQALCRIPYGKTITYAAQSKSIGKPNSFRAVANANGANPLAIIVPCHRVIASDGTLGGYGGGLKVKQGLLEHESGYAGS